MMKMEPKVMIEFSSRVLALLFMDYFANNTFTNSFYDIAESEGGMHIRISCDVQAQRCVVHQTGLVVDDDDEELFEAN
jgi:hypothetical protein